MTRRNVVIDGIAATVVIPTREDVQNLQVGDVVPDCFGRDRKVTRIHAQRDDINGRAFVCLYTEMDNGSISGSFKEGEMHRDVALCARFTSAQLDAAERGAL